MDGYTRGEEFLELYNELDHFLKKSTDTKGSMPFWKRLRIAAKTSPIIKRNLDELLEFHELRNAIVHHRAYPRVLIAMPSDEVVDQMQQIVSQIMTPVPVVPKFQREIHVFTADSPLSDALIYMSRRDFRQIVARDREGRLVLLTSRGIAKWLLSKVDGEPLDFGKVMTGDLFEYETPEGVRFIGRNATTDEALQVFEEANIRKPRRLFAILVTENGKADEEPLGIITPNDLLGEEE